MRHRGVQAGEGVVEEQPRAHVEAVPGPVLEREQEGRRVDQMRGDLLDEEPPLVQGLAHELDVEVLEVAQPAVDQLAGAARGAGGEVALFDQGHRQAAAGGVEGDPAAGHAATDDEHVECLRRDSAPGHAPASLARNGSQYPGAIRSSTSTVVYEMERSAHLRGPGRRSCGSRTARRHRPGAIPRTTSRVGRAL